MERLRALKPNDLLRVAEALAQRAGGGAAVATVLDDLGLCEINSQPPPIVPVQQPPQKKKRKVQRPFDMTRFAQRRVALHVAYFGERYHGFAAQALQAETVEAHIFSALRKTCLVTDIKASDYTRCGRTDRGVSGLGQVIALNVRSALSHPQPSPSVAALSPVATAAAAAAAAVETSAETLEAAASQASNDSSELDYASILNRVLPDDILVLGWSPVPTTGFNARFDSTYRTYRYYFPRRELDVNLMQRGADLMVGCHDFRNFCKMDVTNVRNFVRRIESACIMSCNSGDAGMPSTHDMFCLQVRGTAFLWHQVRCLVAILFLVGRGLEDPSVVTELLDVQNNPRRPVYAIAPELPLLLYECGHDAARVRFTDARATASGALEHTEVPLRWRYTVPSLRRVTQQLEERWSRLAREATMTREMLNFIEALPVISEEAATTDGAAASKRRWDSWGTNERGVPRSCYEESHVHKVSSIKPAAYVPLMQREKCNSYEERVASLSDKAKATIKAKHGWDL